MNIHHLRNATCVIEAAGRKILVDPMLSNMGELPPFSFLRYKARRNPIVPLPPEAQQILEGTSHCLITHSQTFGIRALQHSDHLDSKGEAFLKEHNISVICRADDAPYLKKHGMRVELSLDYWQQQSFEGGLIITVPAQHGHGWNHHLMANGAGFFLDLPGEPSLYIGGDTVLTVDVERALEEYQPDISILAAGSAQLDVGPPILMCIDEIIRFIEKAPGKVILNHLEALNHCPTTRKQLRDILSRERLLEKTFIPEDGDLLSFEH